MKVGDLVKIKAHCSDAGSLAIIIGRKFPASRLYQIMFCGSGKISEGYDSNLEVISEGR